MADDKIQDEDTFSQENSETKDDYVLSDDDFTVSDAGTSDSASESESGTGGTESSSADGKKDNGDSFAKKFFSFLDKSVEAGKKGLVTAGNAISEFGDKSVTRIEISQMKSKRAKVLLELGRYVFETVEKGGSVSETDEEILKFIGRVKKFDEDIAQREASVQEKSAKAKKE